MGSAFGGISGTGLQWPWLPYYALSLSRLSLFTA